MGQPRLRGEVASYSAQTGVGFIRESVNGTIYWISNRTLSRRIKLWGDDLVGKRVSFLSGANLTAADVRLED